MAKNKEIERRWLLKDIPKLGHDTTHDSIAQYYVEENGKKVRYRHVIRWSPKEEEGEKFFKTTKKKLGHGEWEEDEVELTMEEFKSSVTNGAPKVVKSRYYLEHSGLVWELDYFLNMNLMIVEVELDDINQDIEIPEVFKKNIIMEITGIDEFQNSSLAW